MNQYGLDSDKLAEFISTPPREKTEYGSETIAVSRPEYSLRQICLNAGKKLSLATPENQEAAIYVEEGEIDAAGIDLSERNVIVYGPKTRKTIEAKADSVVYVFFGEPGASSEDYEIKKKTFDYREKYWGDIQTIVSKGYASKRIFCRKGAQSSLEFHCKKIESYFVHSGKLLVRFRAGRAEDKFFEMPSGKAVFMPPGLMHQRGGLADTVIIEISTRDDDADSFLVEDGQKTPMPSFQQ